MANISGCDDATCSATSCPLLEYSYSEKKGSPYTSEVQTEVLTEALLWPLGSVQNKPTGVEGRGPRWEEAGGTDGWSPARSVSTEHQAEREAGSGADSSKTMFQQVEHRNSRF